MASHSLSMATSLTPVCQVKSPGADKVPLVNSWGSVAHHSPLHDCGRRQGSQLSPALCVHMFVCLCVHMCACVSLYASLCMHVCTDVYLCCTRVSVHLCAHTCLCACICVSVSTFMCVPCTYSVHMCISVCEQCVYVCMCTCVCGEFGTVRIRLGTSSMRNTAGGDSLQLWLLPVLSVDVSPDTSHLWL